MTIQEITDKLYSAYTCSLGKMAISGYPQAKREFEKLPEEDQNKIMEEVDRRYAEYHEPIEGLESGESAYDLNMKFLYS